MRTARRCGGEEGEEGEEQVEERSAEKLFVEMFLLSKTTRRELVEPAGTFGFIPQNTSDTFCAKIHIQ